ncbi:MAG: hypothetical protein H6613_03400 [Ignavibacteriales bacterium]|nr:hypothetical protein [Ignavibacteriales bacterium]
MSDNGWEPISASQWPFSTYTEYIGDTYYGTDTEYYIEDIIKVGLVKYNIDYKSKMKGDNKLEYINWDNPSIYYHSLLLVNNRLLVNPENIIDTFFYQLVK